jgi:RNA polymerase sigma factor (sigma-70 family)
VIDEWSEKRPMTAAARHERWRTARFGVLGDERLAQRAGAGDDRAFAVVYDRYRQILYRYCRSILNNDADAQDALQSTFAAAFACLRGDQRDAPMRPWLFRIAHNESISILRRRRPALELSRAPEHATTSIEDQVAERAALSALLRDLRQLTDRQRSALVLRELSGLSHQEIAIALGTSVGAAKQTIFEARQSLFEFAEGRAMACDEIRRTISDADGRSLRSRRVRAHLRECGGCAAFVAAIPARTGELRALAPALPGVGAAGLLGRIAISSAGRSGGTGMARLAAGAAAKTASASTGFGANALAGVAVVATATAGVTVGVGNLVHRMPHRDPVRSGVYAPAGPARAAPGPTGSPLGAAANPRARAGGMPGGPAAGSRTARSRRTFVGARWSGGDTGSRSVRIDGSDVGKGSVSSGAGGQAGLGKAYSNADGYRWSGGPARARSGQTPPPSASTSAASGSAESTRGSGKGNQGSGKLSRARPRQPESGASSADGSDPSAGTSTLMVAVNAALPANVSPAAGSATTAIGTATTEVGSVTSTAVGTVTSTVGGVLSGKYHHRISP